MNTIEGEKDKSSNNPRARVSLDVPTTRSKRNLGLNTASTPFGRDSAPVLHLAHWRSPRFGSLSIRVLIPIQTILPRPTALCRVGVGGCSINILTTIINSNVEQVGAKTLVCCHCNCLGGRESDVGVKGSLGMGL